MATVIDLRPKDFKRGPLSGTVEFICSDGRRVIVEADIFNFLKDKFGNRVAGYNKIDLIRVFRMIRSNDDSVIALLDAKHIIDILLGDESY